MQPMSSSGAVHEEKPRSTVTKGRCGEMQRGVSDIEAMRNRRHKLVFRGLRSRQIWRFRQQLHNARSFSMTASKTGSIRFDYKFEFANEIIAAIHARSR